VVRCLDAFGDAPDLVGTAVDTDKTERRFSPAYWDAAKLALTEQAVLGLFSAMTLDCGVTAANFFYSLVGYWVGFSVALARRPRTPTKTDVVLMKCGPILLFGVSFAISPLIWRLMGAL